MRGKLSIFDPIGMEPKKYPNVDVIVDEKRAYARYLDANDTPLKKDGANIALINYVTEVYVESKIINIYGFISNNHNNDSRYVSWTLEVQ